MKSIRPFAWRRLSSFSELEHRIDADGALRLRGADADAPPLSMARVNKGKGVFELAPLHALGLTWLRAHDGDGWILRTLGAPVTMPRLTARWGELVRAAADPLGIDERFVLTTIACEAGDARRDADGYVRAPRTERGYPGRTGETDHGDLERDAEDWRASHGAHSSHGLMQTLISTATTVRPDLFKGIEPARYRQMLWVPENSLACGVAFLARFPASVLSDPLACRFKYGAGSAHASSSNVWGFAPLYDDRVPLRFIAYWNDDACVRTGQTPDQGSPHTSPWIAGVVAFSVAAAAACGVAYLTRKALAS